MPEAQRGYNPGPESIIIAIIAIGRGQGGAKTWQEGSGGANATQRNAGGEARDRPQAI